MRVEYDPAADCMYVYRDQTIADGAVARTLSLDERTNVDVDERGELLGVEVLFVGAELLRAGQEAIRRERAARHPASGHLAVVALLGVLAWGTMLWVAWLAVETRLGGGPMPARVLMAALMVAALVAMACLTVPVARTCWQSWRPRP